MSFSKYINVVKKWTDFYQGLWHKIFNVIRFDKMAKVCMQIKNSLRQEIKIRYQSLKYQILNTGNNNLNLCKTMFYHGNFRDCILRGKMALFFKPELTEANYYIGRTYFQLLEFKKAEKYLQSYLKGSHKLFTQEAKFCLDALSDERNQDVLEIPRYIIESNRRQRYSQPDNPEEISIIDRLFVPIIEYVNNNMRPYGNNVIDLNCGSGRFGQLFKESKVATSIEGSDIAIEAVLKAGALTIQQNKVYQYMVHKIPQECIDHYIELNNKFDIIIAHNLLSYLTNGYYFLMHARHIMKPNSIVVLTFCLTSEPDIPIELDRYNETFYLSINLIKQMIEDAEMQIVSLKNLSFLNNEAGVILIIKDKT